jgi:hypothetical protein
MGKWLAPKKVGLCKRKFAEVVSLRSCVLCVFISCISIWFISFHSPVFGHAEGSTSEKRSRTTKHTTQAERESNALDFLCATLAVAEADLYKLPPAFLQDTIAKAKASPQEKAAALLALAAAAPKDKNLADYYREKDERQTFPWKNLENRAHIQLQHFTAAFAKPDPFEHQKKNFVAQAKAGQLTPLENVVLQYVLFGKTRISLASPSPTFF